jgi:hypothetical protein
MAHNASIQLAFTSYLHATWPIICPRYSYQSTEVSFQIKVFFACLVVARNHSKARIIHILIDLLITATKNRGSVFGFEFEFQAQEDDNLQQV